MLASDMVKVDIYSNEELVDTSAVKGADLEAMVDEDINAFELWFKERGLGDNLLLPERAVIKTYLWWKTHGGQ